MRTFRALLRVGTLGGATDGQLLDRFVSGGEQEASLVFAALVDRHGPMVLRTCRRVLGDAHDAEDPAQAAFLILARRARSIRRRDSVASWLFGVAYRAALRARKQAARRRELERRGAEMAARRVVDADRDGHSDLVEALDRLPEAYRAPLVLCYLEGLTQEQAAASLSLPVRTLQRRLAEGRERLRRRLAGRGTAAEFGAGPVLGAPAPAELPTAWAEATVRAAVRVAGGQEAAGIASAAAVSLAKEVSRAMFRTKLLMTAAVLGAGSIALGLLPLARGQKGSPDGPPKAALPGAVAAAIPGKPGLDPPPPVEGPGRVFHLAVEAADTGRPIPRASVRVWIALRDDWRTADDRGRLDIVHSTGPADDSFSVDVAGDGYALQRHYWGGSVPREEIPDGATVRLQPGEALGGAVRDEQGRPVAGATVLLWSHNYKKRDPHELLFDLPATTGPDGRWQTRSAPETTGELLAFRVVHPDFASDLNYGNKDRIPPIADLRAGRAVSVLTRGLPIEGRVVDAAGRPVAGARVGLAENRSLLDSELDVATDADGRFRTWQLKPGEYFLLARAPGHAPGEKTVKVGKEVPQVEIALGRPRVFKGRVVDADGRPMRGAFVNVDTWRGCRFLRAFLWTDAEGRFHWDDAPGDPLLINVSEAGYFGEKHRRVLPSDDDVVFTLRNGLAISGTVRDAETGEKVQNAEVEYGAVDVETGEVEAWQGDPRMRIWVGQGDLHANFPTQADAYRLRITAEGYEPFVSRTFRSRVREYRDYRVQLVPAKPGAGPVATALRPDGRPLAGALVYVTAINEGLNVGNDGVQGRRISGRDVRTGPDGTFAIPQLKQPFLVLIVGDDVYAYASKEALAASPQVRARPYGRIEGRYLIGDRPASNLPITLYWHLQDRSTMHCTLHVDRQTTTDAEGRFTFEQVIPIPHLRVARHEPTGRPGRVWTLGQAVPVAPGATARVTVGGKGQPVIGRLAPPEGWDRPIDFTDRCEVQLASDRPFYPYPPRLFRDRTGPGGNDWSAWSEQWRASPEGQADIDSFVRISTDPQPDGSFRFDDVPAGNYRLVAVVNEESPYRDPGPFAARAWTLTIPPIPGGRSDEPLDLGPLRLTRRVTLKAGDPAPPFEVTTVDGRRLTLADYRGKYLLLDFGTMWDEQSRFQIARMNGVYQAYRDDDRLVILGLVLAADTPEARRFVAEKGQPWPQALVGPLSNPLADAYGVEGRDFSGDVPAEVLIGPDGRIVAGDLLYTRILEGVTAALAKDRKDQ